MNPLLRWRPTIAFVVALVIWAPSGNSFVHGNLDVVPTGVRFLVALTVAWVGISLLAIVVGGYGQPSDATDHRDLPPDTLED